MISDPHPDFTQDLQFACGQLRRARQAAAAKRPSRLLVALVCAAAPMLLAAGVIVPRLTVSEKERFDMPISTVTVASTPEDVEDLQEARFGWLPEGCVATPMKTVLDGEGNDVTVEGFPSGYEPQVTYLIYREDPTTKERQTILSLTQYYLRTRAEWEQITRFGILQQDELTSVNVTVGVRSFDSAAEITAEDLDGARNADKVWEMVQAGEFTGKAAGMDYIDGQDLLYNVYWAADNDYWSVSPWSASDDLSSEDLLKIIQNIES